MTPLDPEGLPAHWAQLTRIAAAVASHSPSLTESALARSEELLRAYRARGHLPDLLLREAVAVHEVAGVAFYNLLYRQAGLDGRRPPSPVAGERDPSWMGRTDYCFVNARATARLASRTGTFLDASRLLPVLRCGAIHLAPFFESVFGIVYAQDSFTVIADEVTHLPFEALGLSRCDQLRYFVDCCHLLGKAVGFDLTSHTSGFSKVSLDRPELFRWLRFAPDLEGLHGGMTVDQQYEEEVQASYAAHITALVGAVCREHDLPCLEVAGADTRRLAAVHAKAKAVVRSCGYYPVVPHTWNGVGLPGLERYDKVGDHPRWDYRDERGQDQSAHAIGIHASFKLHTGLRSNAAPPGLPESGAARREWRERLPRPFQPTARFLAELFPRMHERYGFDFLRIDYVDHVFRNTVEEDGAEVVRGEQLSPALLRTIAAAARAAFPAAGMLADHVGLDVDRYERAGFQAILGREVQHPLDKARVLELFRFNHQLVRDQQRGRCAGTATFPIDTHDMGHFALLGKDLAEREDRATVLLRHFFSRFASAGLGRRPKYEVLGNQDLSSGIFRANNQPVSMTWSSDRAALAGYHLVEDAYETCREDWRAGRLEADYVHDGHCWWTIACPDRGVTYLALTWYGSSYPYDEAMGRRLRTVVPAAALGRAGSGRPELEVVLGLRPVRGAGDPASARLDAGHLETAATPGGDLELVWPNLTSWLLRLRARR